MTVNGLSWRFIINFVFECLNFTCPYYCLTDEPQYTSDGLVNLEYDNGVVTINWTPPDAPSCIVQYNIIIISSTSVCTINETTTNTYYSIFYDETCESVNGFLVSLDGAGRPGPNVSFYLGGTCTCIIIYMDDGFQQSGLHYKIF